MLTLRQLRDARGFSQAHVAAKLGVTGAAVSQYESGKRKLSILRARRLADALGCTVDEVVAAAEATVQSEASA